MNTRNKFPSFRRLLRCVIGLAICGFGVALSTRPNLGTSPISSLPYACTFVVHWTFGTWTVLINLLFLTGQALVLKKEFHWTRLSQILAVMIFGLFIDLGMWFTSFYMPQFYPLRVIEQLLGCFLLALGISAQLIADVSYMPGDGLVKVLSDHYHLIYGYTKIAFDCTLVLSAICVSLIFTHRINGLREGTIIATFCVGSMIRMLHTPMQRVKLLINE